VAFWVKNTEGVFCFYKKRQNETIEINKNHGFVMMYYKALRKRMIRNLWFRFLIELVIETVKIQQL
jgi:hypothetical protein